MKSNQEIAQEILDKGGFLSKGGILDLNARIELAKVEVLNKVADAINKLLTTTGRR